jgi:predicted RNase H-like nuclease (RuvC/YqgF family)
MLDQTMGEVAERSKEIDKKQEAIEARNAQLEKEHAEKDKGLQAYTERLEKEQKELDRRNEDLRKIEEDLKKRADAINGMDEMLKKKESDLAAREADYNRRKGELENAYKDVENKVKELSEGMATRNEEPAPDTYKSLGGDVEKPTAEKLTGKVKKMKIGKKAEVLPEIELARTVTSDGKSTAAAALTQAAPQAAAEGVLYKHEFPIGQQGEVVKVLDGFDGMESSKMTGPDTKYMLTGRKAEKERNECDYSYNKGEVKVEFTTKNPAVDAMLAGVKLGQKFTPIRVRPKDRDNKIKEFPDFADLKPKKTGTDEKGDYFIYDLNDEQKKRYNIKALPPKKAKADGQ